MAVGLAVKTLDKYRLKYLLCARFLRTGFSILGSLWGLESLTLRRDVTEKAFHQWFCMQHPEFMTEEGRRAQSQFSHIKEFGELNRLTPHQFFNIFMQAGAHGSLV